MKTLAKKKYKRRSSKKKKYRRAKPKIPLEVAITGAAIPFVKPRDWHSATPFQRAQAGDWEGVMKSLMDGFTPVSFEGQVDVMAYINPFNLNSGRYMKMLLYAGLASKFRRRFVNIPMNKIPIIGRYIS